MNPRVRLVLVAGGCLVLGAAGGVGGTRWWQDRSKSGPGADKSGAGPGDAPGEKAPGPAALVQTAAVVEGDFHRTIEAIGVAAIPPNATSVVAWPADAVVERLMVLPGQMVDKDAPLAQITITRDAQTQIALAQQTVASAKGALDMARQRLDRGLATRPELLAAQTLSAEAGKRLERLRTGLPPADGMLRSPEAGLIGSIRVPMGATVLAGSPIVDITAPGAMVAQMAVEPADSSAVAVGQSFEVRPLDDRDPARYHGTITLIGPAVNPISRLLEITVALAGPDLPRAGTALRGSGTLPSVHATLIPRGALIPDGAGMVVFIVRQGKARRTPVTVSHHSGDRVAITKGCTPGDRVVVVGQGQLTDGAAVREEPALPADQPKGAAGADR